MLRSEHVRYFNRCGTDCCFVFSIVNKEIDYHSAVIIKVKVLNTDMFTFLNILQEYLGIINILRIHRNNDHE